MRKRSYPKTESQKPKAESRRVRMLEPGQPDLGWLADAHRLLRFRTMDAPPIY